MNKSLKQKRKQKRDAKRELKNHTNQTYTDDSIQETLRQIRLVQNQNIRQNKEKYGRYISLLERTKVRAQKKIYYWWIQICYDINRPVGKRMAEQSWNKIQDLCNK